MVMWRHDIYCGIQEHLFELEADESVTAIEASQATYVVYPDETAGNWRIQAVPLTPESFESRKALPEVWRGLRDDELSRVSGIEGGIFIHASGFIGGVSFPSWLYPFIFFLTILQATRPRKVL